MRTQTSLRIPPTRNTFPVVFSLNWAHWTGTPGGGCCHGPCSQSWPWWKLISALWCNLQISAPSSGYRVWVYTRWGTIHSECFIDRRPRDRRKRNPKYMQLISGREY